MPENLVEVVLEGITPFLNKHSGVVFVSSVMVSRVEKFGDVPTSAGGGSLANFYGLLKTTKVVIGGIFTSTLLTLLILPSVYEKFGVKIEKHENGR
jgi:hypothetical protein